MDCEKGRLFTEKTYSQFSVQPLSSILHSREHILMNQKAPAGQQSNLNIICLLS